MRCAAKPPFCGLFQPGMARCKGEYNPPQKTDNKTKAVGMRNFCSLIRTIGLLAMVFVVSALHAQDGLSDALLRLDFSNGLLGPSIATADFNNDTYPDAAVLLRSNHNFRIEVPLPLHEPLPLRATL